MTLFLGLSLYAVMVLAAPAVEVFFMLLGRVPTARNAMVSMAHISLNDINIVKLVFGRVAVVWVFLFARTGGREMMRMMSGGGHAKKHGYHHAKKPVGL